jgi:small basic protein
MLFPLLGLLIGLFVGFYTNISVPVFYAPYMSVAVLAALDSVFGGIKAIYENNFEMNIFITGFFSNTLLAGMLAYFGDRLGIPLYLAAIFAFGVRIFHNLAVIRRHVIKKVFKKNN